jgi:SAM-dependent methyltransferase
MFWPDVMQLKEFYASPMGEVAARIIGAQVRNYWPNLRGETILGVGYTTPFLAPFVDEAERILALMPAMQGAMAWPPSRPNRAFLAQESEIPLPDNSVSRMLLVHVLENSQHLGALIEEAWRVLAPNGKLLVAVANRHGMWARAAGSPFAYGQPFSTTQLRRIFAQSQFTCAPATTHLFMPPSHSPFFRRWANIFEKSGELFFSRLGGVLMMEAEKQIYAVRSEAVRAVHAPRVYVPVPATKPA